VATGIIAAIEQERYGEPILLSGHNISTEGLFTRICELGGVPRPRFYALPSAAVMSTFASEIALGVAGQRSPLPSLAAVLANANEWQSVGSAQLELGVAIRSLSQTLLDAIEWYREIGYC
jgi:hypothetical protein